MISYANLPDKLLAELFKDFYYSSTAFKSENVELLVEPFKVLRIRNLLEESDFKRVLEEVEQLELQRKDNDLYSLRQSGDLQEVTKPAIEELIVFLREGLRPSLEHILRRHFNDKLSLTASLYQQADVLLCHDDKCEDRCVAFVYYLTEPASSACGGDFEMFTSDENGQPLEVRVSMSAERNSLICFEVNNYSYHQVTEVKGASYRRLSVNGWFHGPVLHGSEARRLVPTPYVHPPPPLINQKPLQGLIMLTDFINSSYCTPRSVDQMRQAFTHTSQILLGDFFTPELFNQFVRHLQSDSVAWNRVGPPNRRCYMVAEVESLSEEAAALIDLLVSPLFVHYLKSISGLDLIPHSETTGVVKGSGIRLEVQKWQAGCYSMATDTDAFFSSDGLDLFFFFEDVDTNSCGGQTTYLASNPDPGEDPELLTVEPRENAVAAVYRTKDTVRFTKYLNCNFTSSLYTVAATYYEHTLT